MKKHSAFTLIEMVIAITVFTIFIGTAIGSFLFFHRAQQDAAASRKLIFEAENIVTLMTELVKESKIDYSYKECEICGDSEVVGANNTDTIAFLSLDELTQTIIELDSDEEILTILQNTFNETSEEFENADAYDEPALLHSNDVYVDSVNFRIFPNKDPFENLSNNDLQYQPNVKIEITLKTLSRSGAEKKLSFETTLTSRIYQ